MAMMLAFVAGIFVAAAIHIPTLYIAVAGAIGIIAGSLIAKRPFAFVWVVVAIGFTLGLVRYDRAMLLLEESSIEPREVSFVGTIIQ